MTRAMRKTRHEPNRKDVLRDYWFSRAKRVWQGTQPRRDVISVVEQPSFSIYDKPVFGNSVPFVTKTIDYRVERWRNADGENSLKVTVEGVTFWDGPDLEAAQRLEREQMAAAKVYSTPKHMTVDEFDAVKVFNEIGRKSLQVQSVGRALRPVPVDMVPIFPKLKHAYVPVFAPTYVQSEPYIAPEPYDRDKISKLLHEYGIAEEYHELCHRAIEQRFAWKTDKFGPDQNHAYAVEKFAAFFNRVRPWAWIGPEGEILRVPYACHAEAARMFLGIYADVEDVWAHVSEKDRLPEDALRYVKAPTIKQKLAVKKFYREYVELRGNDKGPNDL